MCLALSRLRLIRPRPGTDEQLPWTVPVLGLVVLVLVVGGALWLTLDWLERVAADKAEPNTAIGGKDFVTAKLDAVKIALNVVASGGALVGSSGRSRAGPAVVVCLRIDPTIERCLGTSVRRRGVRTWRCPLFGKAGGACGSRSCRR